MHAKQVICEKVVEIWIFTFYCAQKNFDLHIFLGELFFQCLQRILNQHQILRF
jgi:hypothetical protein